jgi:hypothetical protein
MRRVAAASSFVCALAAQQPELGAIMERLAGATTALQQAAANRDRSAYGPQVSELTAQLAALRRRAADLPAPAHADLAVGELEAALADLQQPVDDGAASDAWDLSRLRRACTTCHVTNRDRNDERGMFPNRGNVVAGTLRLFEQDGGARDDAADIAIFLERVGARPEPRPRPPQISQRGRRFDPAVLVVTRGTTVRFPNDDGVFHAVFSLSRGNAFVLGT